MAPRIESRVQRGEFKGDVQTPWQDADGFYIASSERFESEYIRVADLESLANAILAGLKVRMKADRQKVAGLVMPSSITIDGKSADAWKVDRPAMRGRT